MVSRKFNSDVQVVDVRHVKQVCSDQDMDLEYHPVPGASKDAQHRSPASLNRPWEVLEDLGGPDSLT